MSSFISALRHIVVSIPAVIVKLWSDSIKMRYGYKGRCALYVLGSVLYVWRGAVGIGIEGSTNRGTRHASDLHGARKILPRRRFAIAFCVQAPMGVAKLFDSVEFDGLRPHDRALHTSEPLYVNKWTGQLTRAKATPRYIVW